MLVRLKGVAKVRKKLASGSVLQIHYAWRGGPVIWRSDWDYDPGSPRYISAYEAAHGEVAQSAKGKFRELLVKFLNSEEFGSLSDSYRRDLRWAVGKLDAKFGDAPKAVFDRPEIRRRVQSFRREFKPRDADRIRQGLTKIVKWAIEEEELATNQVAGLKGAYAADRHHLIWTDDEIEAAIDAASDVVGDAISLWAETGLRPGDLCNLTAANVRPSSKGKILRVRTSKRGRWASIPVTPAAARIIDERPAGQEYLIRPSESEKWAPRYLSQEIKKAARAAGVRDELHPYDLRGSAVSRLVLAGVNTADLALVMGWKPETAAKMIGIYADLDPRRADGVRDQLAELRASGLRLVVG